MKKKKTVLRVGKVTYGTRDMTEAFQVALEPYFREEHTVETIKKEVSSTPKRSEPSSEALEAMIKFLLTTSVPRLLAEKDKEKQTESNVQNSPNGKD